jgi:hypothetical protein
VSGRLVRPKFDANKFGSEACPARTIVTLRTLFEELAVGYLSRRIHAEAAKHAERAEKTSKEAAAHALPAARAAGLGPALPEGHHAAFLSGLSISACSA